MRTHEMVNIGQHWRRTARRTADRHVVKIVQVHRADREVLVALDGAPDQTMRISFSDLRAKYRLIDNYRPVM